MSPFFPSRNMCRHLKKVENHCPRESIKKQKSEFIIRKKVCKLYFKLKIDDLSTLNFIEVEIESAFGANFTLNFSRK